MKNKFFTPSFVAFAALQQRFCFAKPAPIPTERKLSLRESHENFYDSLSISQIKKRQDHNNPAAPWKMKKFAASIYK